MQADFTQKWPNLASAKAGAEAIFATDDFFADKSRMLNDAEAVFIDDKYDDHGKWMDGWESRRKRVAGYDYCVVRLAYPGTLYGVDIDTSHFTGNYPPAASLEACYCAEGDPTEDANWQEILPAVNLQGNSHHLHEIVSKDVFTHLRLNIFPDGGVARLRVYGQVFCDWSKRDTDQRYDLAAMENGGRGLACSDAHYGHPRNLLGPGRGGNMGDGWETRRRREPGNDWCIIALGQAGTIEEIIVDTAHFKGNYPDRCSIQAAKVPGGTDESLITQSMFWSVLLPEQPLSMDAIHAFKEELVALGEITHVRLNIIPDGGVSRLRLIGKPSKTTAR
jgi:allantoicase